MKQRRNNRQKSRIEEEWCFISCSCWRARDEDSNAFEIVQIGVKTKKLWSKQWKNSIRPASVQVRLSQTDLSTAQYRSDSLRPTSSKLNSGRTRRDRPPSMQNQVGPRETHLFYAQNRSAQLTPTSFLHTPGRTNRDRPHFYTFRVGPKQNQAISGSAQLTPTSRGRTRSDPPRQNSTDSIQKSRNSQKTLRFAQKLYFRTPNLQNNPETREKD